jgi:hypothetical protein
MRDNLQVLGDGTTHYYLQGPIFINDEDASEEELLRWNQAEDTNVQEKDMGAIKGTNLRDLCNQVGGMAAGERLKIKASDGLSRWFAYKNVYQYSTREGPMVLAWYCNGQYPDTGYSDGLRLMWLADDSVNPWGIHVFGNWDWRQAASSEYWYYYQDSDGKHPTTTGLSVRYISQIEIYSNASAQTAAPTTMPVSSVPSWDLNGDHTCNVSDVVIIGQQWGRTGSPGWIKEDVNQDGAINIGDVVALGLHWNASW